MLRDLQPPISPLNVPGDARTVMFFGGTFDPAHVYHTMLPLMALARLFPDEGWLVYVPTSRNPLKTGESASEEHRLAMLNLALDRPGRRSVWTDEIDRARWLRERGREIPSFTIDTLRRAKETLPERVSIRLLIGADQAANFHQWRDFRSILEIATPVVLPRGDVERVDQLYEAMESVGVWSKRELSKWSTWMAPVAPMPISSTQLREAIAGAALEPEAWSKDRTLRHVSLAVARYIVEHKLFGVGTQRRKGGNGKNGAKGGARTAVRVVKKKLAKR